MKVLIVGAGPTGLTAALELARHAVIVKVIEKKSVRSSLSRAVGILPGSLQLLRPSGVSDGLLDRGIKVDCLNFYNQEKHLATVSLQNASSEHPYLLALAQDKTEETIEGILSAFGGQVNYSTALTDIRQTDKAVIVYYSNGKQEEFDIVLAADGAHSQTRSSLGLDYPGFELAHSWSIADVDAINWLHPFEFTACLLNQGHALIVVPLEANRYRLISNTADVLSTLPLPMTIRNIRRTGQFEIAIRQLRNYRCGRVYFAGDAAHCHSPFGGRGMNLGIADAAEFATRLLNKTLDHYSDSRHTAGLNTINESERFRKIITNPNLLVSALMKTGLKAINHSSKLQGFLANRLLGDV